MHWSKRYMFIKRCLIGVNESVHLTLNARVSNGITISRIWYMSDTWPTSLVCRLKELTTCLYILAIKIAGPISHFAAGNMFMLHQRFCNRNTSKISVIPWPSHHKHNLHITRQQCCCFSEISNVVIIYEHLTISTYQSECGWYYDSILGL